MKQLLLIIGIFVLILICIGAWPLFKKNTTDTAAIYLSMTELEDKTFTTDAGFVSGAIYYSGYDYTIDGETMYVSIKNRLFIGTKGGFSIEIKDDKLQHVKKVYLQGEDKSDTYQIWPILEE